MSAVFSGGLVYEYSEEGSKYGLVQISGSSVSELDDFGALQSALSGQSNPSGDGGYKASGAASTCPPQSGNWDVSGDQLPAIPDPAKKYMTQGAGAGVGLGGSGSQNAGTKSSGFASPGSGSVNGSPTKKSDASLRAPPMTFAPVMCGLVVVLSSALGASLL